MRRVATFLLIGLCSLPVIAEPPASIDGPALLQRLTAKDAGVVVLDVRTQAEYDAGHLPGAVNVPHDQVESRAAELAAYKDKEIVVYCRTGRRSEVARGTLAKLGFRNVVQLEGDWVAWSEAGRPIETAPVPAK